MPGNPGPNINRYLDLISEIPRGQFYDAEGIRIPYQGAKPYDLVVQTSVAARTFGIFVNSKFRGTITTDSNAVARFSVVLDHGRNEVTLEDDITAQRIRTFLDARTMHTIHAALAEAIENIDANIQDTYNDRIILLAERGEVEDVWGKRLLHPNTPAYQLDAYREQLQEVHQAYRMFGGRRKGLDSVVSAVTTATPMAWPLRSFGPRWCLGLSFLRDAGFQARNRTQWTRVPPVTGVTIDDVGAANQLGAGALDFTAVGQTLRWTTPGGGPGAAIAVGAGGQFDLPAVPLVARLDGLVNGPFAIVAATNDRLRLNLDGIGTIDITLTAGGARTAAQVAADINAALVADTRYGAPFGASASVLTTQRVRIEGLVPGASGSVVLENVSADAYFVVLGYPWIRSTLVNPEAIGSTALELVTSDRFPDGGALAPFEVLVARSTVREEVVTVSANNKTTDVLTVAAPGLAKVKLAGDTVEMKGVLPREVRGSENEGEGITVTVVAGALPGGNVSEALTLLGSDVSDGWLADNVAAADLLAYGFFDAYQLALTNDGTGDTTLEADADDRVWQYREWPFVFSVWARNHHMAPIHIVLGVNFGSGWVEGALTAVPSVNADNGMLPTFLSLSTVLPAGATQFKVRVRHDSAGVGETIELMRAKLTQPNVTAASLGINTTPRSEHRGYFGELIYIWSPVVLTAAEDALVGLDSPTPMGHVDYVLPAHVEGDRFDVSEYTAGVPKNLKGAFTEVELLGATVTNMSLAIRTPERRSFLEPSRISQVTGETMEWPDPPVAPYVAALAVESNEDQTAAQLYEDGVLVPNDRWQFNSSTEIEVTAGFNSGAVYLLDYQALIRAQSAIIDLGALYSNYVWYVDLHAWTRYEPTLVTIERTSQAVFNQQTRRATLMDASDQDKTTTVLTENNGLVVRTVPSSGYRYLDNKTVQINPDQFKPTAVYTLTFQALRVDAISVPTVTIEYRRAATPAALLLASFAGIDKDEVLPAAGRWLQYRVSFDGIVDIRDVRLSSMSAKGLNLFGVGGSLPILR